MAQKFPGFYLYFDWIDALSTIPATKAMEIIRNMRYFLEDGESPDAMKGSANSIQLMMLAQLTRAKMNAENGRLGGAPAHKKHAATTVLPDTSKGTVQHGEGETLLDYFLKEKLKDLTDQHGSDGGEDRKRDVLSVRERFPGIFNNPS
jgi:hypothetical protein